MEKIGLRASTVRRALIKRLWQVRSQPAGRKGYGFLTERLGLLNELKTLGNRPLPPRTIVGFPYPKKIFKYLSRTHPSARSWLKLLKHSKGK